MIRVNRWPSAASHRRVGAVLVSLLAAVVACALPGTEAPTPFVFPTPNLTLTALFLPAESPDSPDPDGPATPLLAPSPDGGSPTAVDLTATTESPTSAQATVTPISRPAVLAARLAEAPTIDGQFDEWTSDTYSAVDVVYGIGAWSGGGDLSATFRAGWDATYLYLAISVNDDQLVQQASGRELFKGDSAELLLDAELAADSNQASLSGDDYQIGFSAADFVGAGEAYRWFPLPVQGPLTSATVAASKHDNGYQLEIRLPWSSLGIVAASGDEFGFALSVSDNDQSGTAMQQSMVSSASTRVLSDPTSWGRLQLVDG